jgi:peroxiredoxin Q/BCP
VSLDSVDSHKRFAEKNNLPFSLLSDLGGSVSKAYDSLNSFISFKTSKRNTFIIDPEGRIAKIYLSVKPSTHSQIVLNDLSLLQN